MYNRFLSVKRRIQLVRRFSSFGTFGHQWLSFDTTGLDSTRSRKESQIRGGAIAPSGLADTMLRTANGTASGAGDLRLDKSSRDACQQSYTPFGSSASGNSPREAAARGSPHDRQSRRQDGSARRQAIAVTFQRREIPLKSGQPLCYLGGQSVPAVCGAAGSRTRYRQTVL